ncbi:MAG: virulence factor [Anaerolineales bacterium]|nr:virulence factor [Anaerolineales bacterium]
MAKYQIMYWHDIPVQVRAGGRRDRVSIELPQRFQLAVDNAAMAAELTGTDGYLDGFHWSEAEEREGTPEAVANAVAAEVETRFTKIDWRKTAASLKPESNSQDIHD